MRTHLQILTDAGAEAIHERGIAASLNTARSWIQREQIPASAFVQFAEAKLATLEELAAGVWPRGVSLRVKSARKSMAA